MNAPSLHDSVLADTYRSVNDGIHRRGVEEPELFLCECLRHDCSALVGLCSDEYVAVRGSDLRFVVQAGHELAHVDSVVEAHGHYLVVERRAADAAAPDASRVALSAAFS